MFVRGNDVHVSLEARQRTGGNTGFGVEEPLVAVRRRRFRDQLTAIYFRTHVDVIGIDGERALGNQQVGQHYTRTLIFLAQVEQLWDGVECVERVPRRHDETLEIPLARAEHLPEVSLLGLGGNAGGGSGPLNVDKHGGNLHHCRTPNGLGHQRESTARRGTHRTAPRVGGADGHVGHGDLVLHLADHDAEFATVLGHPVEHSRRRTHGVRTVELDAGCRTAHGQRLVAAPHRKRFGPSGHRVSEGFKPVPSILEPVAGHAQVFVHHRLALPLQRQREAILEYGEVQPKQAGHGAEGNCVLDQLVAVFFGEIGDGEGTQLDSVPGVAGLDRIAVEDHPGPRAHYSEVTVHRVLIEAHEEVDLVAMGVNRPVAHPDGEKDVAAPDDRLVGVVGVEVEAAAHSDSCKYVAGRSDSLTGGTADAQREIKTVAGHPMAPFRGWRMTHALVHAMPLAPDVVPLQRNLLSTNLLRTSGHSTRRSSCISDSLRCAAMAVYARGRDQTPIADERGVGPRSATERPPRPERCQSYASCLMTLPGHRFVGP